MVANKILQTVFDEEIKILERLEKLEKRIDDSFRLVNERFDRVEDRITKLSLWLARLKNNTPTIAEFDSLEKRVKKLEHPFAPA